MTEAERESQRRMVRESLDRDRQKDVTPLRAPGERRHHHRPEWPGSPCVYCGLMIENEQMSRLPCPKLMGEPLPTHLVGEAPPNGREQLERIEGWLVAMKDWPRMADRCREDALSEVRDMLGRTG